MKLPLSRFYASSLSKCTRNRQLSHDITQLFATECTYIPNFFHDPSLSTFTQLKRDIIAHHRSLTAAQNDVDDLTDITLPNRITYDLKAMHCEQKTAMNVRLLNDKGQCQRQSNDAFKASLQCYVERRMYEMPFWSATFVRVAEALCAHFECSLVVCSLNHYKDGEDFAKFHFDKYKYHKGHSNKPDLTIGASFGATRDLVFEPCADRSCKIPITQRNGDVFAFSDKINDRFRHSIPKKANFEEERISVIVWGKRKKPQTARTRDSARVSSRPRTGVKQGRRYRGRPSSQPKRW